MDVPCGAAATNLMVLWWMWQMLEKLVFLAGPSKCAPIYYNQKRCNI